MKNKIISHTASGIEVEFASSDVILAHLASRSWRFSNWSNCAVPMYAVLGEHLV